VGLIVDLAAEDALCAAWFQGKALESGSEVLGQVAPHRAPVPGRFVCPPMLSVLISLGGILGSRRPVRAGG
jgi:hypothetical protein